MIWRFFATSKPGQGAKIQIIVVSKTTAHIQIKIKMLTPSQEPPASSKAPYQDLNDMKVLYTFEFKKEPKF